MNRFIVFFTCSVLAISSHVYGAALKISTAYPDGTYVVKSLKAAAKDIATATDNRIKLKIYPGGVQGDNKTVLKKIKRGLLQGALIEGGALAAEYKDGQVYNTPMVFRSFAEVDHVRSKMDAEIIDGFKENGWTLFGLIDGGFAYAMTNKPVSNIDQLKSQKLWLPANDSLSEKVANAFALSPIYLGIGEVLTALQTGAIDAIAAPPSAALTLQWYSRLKYVTDVPFMYTYGTLAFSNKAFDKLKPEDQKVVQQILSETIQSVDQQARKDNMSAFAALSSQGIEPVKPSVVDQESLESQAAKATKYLLDKNEFSPNVLKTLQNHLQAFRGQ